MRENKSMALWLTTLGYGAFLASCGMSTWAGRFPFQSDGISVQDLPALFSLMSILATCIFALTFAVLAYLVPSFSQRIPVVPCVAVELLGLALLANASFFPEHALAILACGCFATGLGKMGTYALWQRVFASSRHENPEPYIIAGTAVSAVIYIALQLAPDPLASGSSAIVLVIISAACLIFATNKIDFEQPMFEDAPRHNARVYRALGGDIMKSALCVGCFLLLNGVIRALTFSEAGSADGISINIISMAGSLVACAVLLLFWRRRTLTFDVIISFRSLFPILTTCLMILPLLPSSGMQLFNGAIHMLSSFASVIMYVQCVQVSRNYGMDPIFTFCIFDTVVTFLYAIGFTIGYADTIIVDDASTQRLTAALTSMWVLGLALHATKKPKRADGPFTGAKANASAIEFLAIMPPASKAPEAGATSKVGESSKDSSLDDNAVERAMALHYRLTTRETEIAKLLARGNSVAKIADILFISENTVRFHSKNIYAKCSIHSKQELIEIFEGVS